MAAFRRYAGLIAALLLALAGGVLVGGVPILGGLLLLLGLGLAAWQGWNLWRTRPDPYDLNRLWEEPFPDEPLPEADESFPDEEDRELDLRYCHACGHAVPPPYATCPDCGRPLR
jgi:Predicted nucleic acid-binding protein, consists of a PIN domain and a Zn-ribbon module